MLAAGLALIASLCYGVSNFVGPAISRGAPVYSVLLAGQFVAFGVSAAVVGAAQLPAPETTAVGAAAVAGLGNALGLIAFYRAATLGPLSIVTPVGSLGAIVPVATGVASGESLGAVKLAGLVLALGGVALASRRPGGPVDPQHADVRRAAVWALAAALGFGLFLTFMAPASDGGVFWAVMLSRVSLLAIMLAAAYLLTAPVRPPLRALPLVAIPGLLLFAGTLAYSYATQRGDLSVVSVLGSLFPLVTVGLAFAFGERIGRTQSLGVAAALAGVVLVSIQV